VADSVGDVSKSVFNGTSRFAGHYSLLLFTPQEFAVFFNKVQGKSAKN
jgi:hypothetical protein